MKTPPMIAFRRSCHKKIKSPGIDSFTINNFVNSSMRSMLGSEEKFSWDTVAQNDSVNDMINKYVTELFMSEDQKKEHAEDEQRRKEEQKRNMENFKFSNFFEDTIGGFFSRLGDDMNELASDVGNAAKGIKGAVVSAWNGVTGAVSTFSEKTGNWFSEGHFKTDDQVEEIRAKERIQEAIRNGTALEEGSAEYNAMRDALYGKPAVKVDNSLGGQIRSLNEMENKINGDKDGKRVVAIENFSQKELDKRLGNKGNCKFTDYMILAEARMRAEGQNTDDFDSNEIYTAAKKKGDKIIKGNSYIVNPDKLMKKAGVEGDISWGRETDSSKFYSTLVAQLDKGNPVMMVLDDNHGEIIYGYEKSGDNLRFLIHDVGYQGDAYLDSKTWQPYQETFDGSFTSYKNGKPWNGYRTTTKLLYLK